MISNAACVIWFTGFSGAGKTTLAVTLEQELKQLGKRTQLLDGDTVRAIFPDTGFTKLERDRHVRRVGHIASLLESHEVITIVAMISPYEESRKFNRSLCKRYIEVFVDAPLEVCERRDVKGLYKKARAGEIEKPCQERVGN